MTDLSTRDNLGVHASRFEVFLLKPELLRALVDFEFEYPSDVQYECIPEAISGKDIICEAKSGMGKTAVFVLSTLHQIDPVIGQVSALVLCRTPELSEQICNEFERFCRYLPDIKVANISEGVKISIHKDILGNKSPHIVVGTPRRIIVLATLKDLSLRNVRHVILDECDQMLEPLDLREFVHDILEMTPIDKQVMMFSATLRKEIRPVCKRLTQQPKELYVDIEVTLKHIEQFYLRFKLLEDENQLLGIEGQVDKNQLLGIEGQVDKNQKLNKLLHDLDFDFLVIFVNDFRDAVGLARLLFQYKFPSMCIHSGMTEEDRLGTYIQFKEGRSSILIANDLVIREIDIAHVDVVVNYDRPVSAQTYFRRVGRLGNKGLAVTFVAADPDSFVRNGASDTAFLNQVEKAFQVKIWMLPDHINNCRYSRKRGILWEDVSLGDELYGEYDIFDTCLHDIDLMLGTL